MNNQTKVTHTPTPWILVPQGDGSSMLAREFETGKQMNPKGLRLVSHVFARGNSLAEDEANAAYIVLAVNCHEELLEKLKMATAWLQNISAREDRMPKGLGDFSELQEAIAKAEQI